MLNIDTLKCFRVRVMITSQQKDVLNQFYESSKYLMRDTESILKQITGLKKKELYVSILL